MAGPASKLLDQTAATLRESAIELPGNLVLLHAEELEANPWNPNEQDDETFIKEMASIRRFGFVVPIVARIHPDKKRMWQIIDGEHRLKGGIQLGMTQFPVYDLGPVSDHEAMQLTIVLNELRGKPEERKLGEVLKRLLNRESIDSLTEVMPYTKEQVAKIAQLPEFDWDGFRERTQRAGAERHVERIFRLSPDASKILDEALAKAKDGDDRVSDAHALEVVASEFVL
jgi:hypothetical protein